MRRQPKKAEPITVQTTTPTTTPSSTAATQPAASKPTTTKTAKTWDSGIQTVFVPKVTFSGSPDFEDQDMILYKPDGMHEDTSWLNRSYNSNAERGYTDRILSEESYWYGIAYEYWDLKETDGYKNTEDKNDRNRVLLTIVRDEIDFVKNSGEFPDTRVSDVYKMKIGNGLWLCFDIYSDDDSAQTRAYSIHDEYINYLYSYAQEGGTKKQESNYISILIRNGDHLIFSKIRNTENNQNPTCTPFVPWGAFLSLWGALHTITDFAPFFAEADSIEIPFNPNLSPN